MKRLAVISVVLVCVGCGGNGTPDWLVQKNRSDVRSYTHGAQPSSVSYTTHLNVATAKVLFDQTTLCRGCTKDSNGKRPSGTDFDFQYSTQTHDLIGVTVR